MKYVIWLWIAFAIPFCTGKKESEDKTIACVGKKVLLQSEVMNLVKAGTNKNDSITIVNSFRDKWIKTQLLIQRAELNLTTEQSDVSKQLEDYKNSLLIFIYEQKLIIEKLDTNISPSELQEYYDKNLSSLLLTKDIVKALYIKVPLRAPDLEKLRSLYRSDKEEDIKTIDSYCFHNAAEYNYFNDDWIFFEEVLSKMPLKIEDKSWFLKTNPFLEVKDSLYQYFLHIKEYKVRGEQAPLFMIEPNVRNIILNKRKMDFLNDLEEKIYLDALKNNKFTVY